LQKRNYKVGSAKKTEVEYAAEQKYELDLDRGIHGRGQAKTCDDSFPEKSRTAGEAGQSKTADDGGYQI
jgi:hypothetical protein